MTAEPTVFCYECKHLVGRRTYLDQAKDWKCAHPSNIRKITKDSVTGMNVYDYKYSTCYDARQNVEEKVLSSVNDVVVRGDVAYKVDKLRGTILLSCGTVGQWYEKYEHFQEPRGSNPLRPRPSADDLLKELEP